MAQSEGDGWTWLHLSEGLAAGIHHALNNRMAALGGAVQVLQGDIEDEHPLVGVLSSELRRLEATAGLLRLLGPSEGRFEPVQVGEIAGQAGRLFEIHHGLRDLRLEVDVPADLLPVWSVPTGLLRTLMMMLAAAAGAIPRATAWGGGGEARAITLQIEGTDEVVHVRAEVPERAAESELPVVTKEAVAGMAQRVGATLRTREEEGRSWWELELLTLPEARRREGTGSS